MPSDGASLVRGGFAGGPSAREPLAGQAVNPSLGACPRHPWRGQSRQGLPGQQTLKFAATGPARLQRFARGHLRNVARPVLVEHARGYGAGGIEAHQVELVPGLAYVVQPNDRLDRLSLGKAVAERHEGPVRLLDHVIS